MKTDENFQDVILQASRIAISTNQNEKKIAARNAVMHAAEHHSPELDRQQMFLSILDGLTQWQILILKLFRNPEQELKKRNIYSLDAKGSIHSLINAIYPELGRNVSLVNALWRDLVAKNLVTGGQILHSWII